MKKRKIAFPQFGNVFLPSFKNIILKGHPIIYPLKQKYICDFNHICIVPNGLVFDDIILNMISNKVLE